MKINKGLEDYLIIESLKKMVEGNSKESKYTYERYLEYSRQYPEEFNKRKQSFLMNCYAVFKKSELKENEK